jgi:hypothetical protein
MKVSVDFHVAPDASEWASLLADNGWKITKLAAGGFECEKVRGNSSTYPLRQPLRWHAVVEESGYDDTISVSVEVPVFADAVYARHRLLGWIKSVAESLNGGWETEAELEVDLLGHVRE